MLTIIDFIQTDTNLFTLYTYPTICGQSFYYIRLYPNDISAVFKDNKSLGDFPHIDAAIDYINEIL